MEQYGTRIGNRELALHEKIRNFETFNVGKVKAHSVDILRKFPFF